MGSQGADLGPEKLVRLGSQIDAAVEAESVLISLTGARPSPSACDFALPGGPTPKTIYRRVLSLKQELKHAFGRYLEQQPPPPLARSLRRQKRLK